MDYMSQEKKRRATRKTENLKDGEGSEKRFGARAEKREEVAQKSHSNLGHVTAGGTKTETTSGHT